MEDNENINKDPDVSTTNSWVFVEKSAANNSSEYYFQNEDASGVQELNEDDLGSSSSCDSDGISVISETECQLGDSCTCLPKINTSDDDEDVPKDDCAISNKEILETNNETDITDEIKTTDVSTKEVVNINNQLNNNNNMLIFASTVAGVCIVITYLLSNYNTATTYHENDVTIDDFDDMLLWTNYEYNDTCDFNIDLSELNTDISNFAQSSGDLSLEPVVMIPTKLQQSDTNLPTSTENKRTIYQNVNNEKYANKQGKHISRNSNKVNGNIKKLKTKTRNADNQKIQTEHLKQQENYLKKKEKYLSKREKYLKKLEKHIVMMETRFRKLFNKMKKDQRFEKQKKSKTNTTATIGGGEWYEKMSFGRSEIRHKEKLSDWMFERSKMRNKLRDKAHWYFNRGNGREEIRHSENLRSGKRNNYKTYRY